MAAAAPAAVTPPHWPGSRRLFVFVTDRDMPATNNVSERNLRPSVIFRKVTHGFRAEWGAAAYAACRSVVSTAKLNSNAILTAIRNPLRPNSRRLSRVSSYALSPGS